MLHLILPTIFTYFVMGLSSFVVFSSVALFVYYGIYRPAKLLFRLVFLLGYYGIILAGLYFIASSLYFNSQSTEKYSCSEKLTIKNEINGKCLEGEEEENNVNNLNIYFNVFIQLTKVVVKSVAKVVVSVFE
uniref:Uncharacterized protein n=1 Tax=Meloidogyne enterolobii TaxID=390850 RepID=A0A6V7VGP6_MELEN|nr:unnamed protein product [Meloidogyne enterolobii]